MKMEITIRRAYESDGKELSQIIQDNARAMLAPYYTRQQWAILNKYYSVEALKTKISKQVIFCAILDNQIVGSIGIDNDIIVGFYTHLDYLNQGIGTKILQHIETFALESGLRQIRLAASPVSLKYYLNRGWEKVENITVYHYDVGFEETLMVKQLGVERIGNNNGSVI